MIALSHVEKWYGAFKALTDINLDGPHGRAASSCAGRRAPANRR